MSLSRNNTFVFPRSRNHFLEISRKETLQVTCDLETTAKIQLLIVGKRTSICLIPDRLGLLYIQNLRKFSLFNFKKIYLGVSDFYINVCLHLTLRKQDTTIHFNIISCCISFTDVDVSKKGQRVNKKVIKSEGTDLSDTTERHLT